jgi:DNA mismatch repair protein MutL
MPYPEIYPNVGLEPKPNIYAKPDGLKPAETRTPDSGPKIQTELLSNRTISSSAPPGPSNIGPIPTRQADPPRIIGQVMGTYILAESNQGLILIDQHAAHERIVYEALNRRHQSLDVVSQDLVVPETLELGHRESDCLNRILQDLEALGFHIEHFGGATYVIKAVPALIAEQEIKPVVVEIVEKTMIDKTGFSRGKWREDCLVLMACHTAIRANKSMNAREMQALLDDLANCENPFHCPHGRPITLAFSKEELEKMFKRVV